MTTTEKDNANYKVLVYLLPGNRTFPDEVKEDASYLIKESKNQVSKINGAS
jgi:hypothetical protein